VPHLRLLEPARGAVLQRCCAPLDEAPAAREVCKTVTVVFCDVTGRESEAEAILDEVATFVSREDFDPQARMRWVRARMLAARGETETAEELAREAVAIVDQTDYVDPRADAHLVLGDLLSADGRSDEAAAEWQRACELWEAKGNEVMAARVRERMES
jgi:ATP/maltotriose-dependent transcriptional regulator MalT